MKKYFFYLLLSFTLLFIISLSVKAEETLFNKTFERGTGAPFTDSRTFIGSEGTAEVILTSIRSDTFNMKNISNSNVIVNGQNIFDLSELKLNTSRLIKEIILIEGENIIEVLMKGKPGRKFEIQITQETVIDYGSIEFKSASPQVIGIKGYGQPETSLIEFTVKDQNGAPILDGTSVDFEMSGPSSGRLPSDGGEYIGDMNDGTPTTASGSTVNGAASVYLNSGTVIGQVIIVATVSGTSLSSASMPISIGGGVPSYTHFTLAASTLNLNGLVQFNKQSLISAFLADRFGNFHVLEGTAISFYSEAGFVDSSAIADSSGTASVTLRTQTPLPSNVSIVDWEIDNIKTLNAKFGTTFPSDGTGGHPRDGWVTMLAIVQGEEAFDDVNRNGEYDLGEPFIDLAEPFIDVNDDGIRNDGTGIDPVEVFIDDDGDGMHDNPNGMWDGPACPSVGCQTSKMIWKDLIVQFTGNATICNIYPISGIVIPDGRNETFNFMVGDYNLNSPIAGTKITFLHSGAGKLIGPSDYTVPDILSSAPFQASFIISDDNPGDVDPQEIFSVELDFSSSELVTCENQTVNGLID